MCRMNDFVKPNEQSQACLSYAMARNRTFKNDFVKPNEQSQARLSYAMARNRTFKNYCRTKVMILFGKHTQFGVFFVPLPNKQQ